MAIKDFDVEFSGSVTPTATSFLKSPAIVMDFKTQIKLDETDGANLANVQKAFQSEMATRLKAQLGHLNTWLTEKNKIVSDLVKKYEALKKSTPFPSTPQEAKGYEAAMKEMEGLAKQVDELKDDYTKIVQDWAENAREQQGRVCMVTAVKNARVKSFDQKSFRVRAGQAIKVILVVAAIAVSIAAIVMTAGTTAPLFIGLAGAGAALAGISSLGGLAKMFKDNATIEKKLMANLAKDVETVQNALKPLDVSKSNIAKHVTELRNLMKIREDNIGKYKNEMLKYKASAKGYTDSLSQLKSKQAADPAEIAKRQKSIDAVNADLKESEGKIAKLEQENTAGRKLLDELSKLNVDLEAISGRVANSVAGNLKERFTKVDGWIDLGNTVGSLVNSASGIHH
jgi:predicted RNase H-like nuclease (RuvC/YqgF family)